MTIDDRDQAEADRPGFIDETGCPTERALARLRRTLPNADADEIAAAAAALVDLAEAATAWHRWASGSHEIIRADGRSDTIDPAARFRLVCKRWSRRARS